MMFTAIAHTSVTNIVLIETIEIPLGLLLAWLLYREKSSWSAVLGALCALAGVAATLVLQMDASPESMAAARMRGGVGYGEFFAAAATVLLVCGAEIGRKQLQTIPLGIFSVFRNIVGALFFLGIGLYVFGLAHFADIFSPLLWGWMLLYGGIVVACGQLAWFAGIKRVRPGDIATASSFSPVAGVLFAGLILGEVPMPAQLIGGGIILVGIAIALWGELRATRPNATTQDRRQSQSLHRRLTRYPSPTSLVEEGMRGHGRFGDLAARRLKRDILKQDHARCDNTH